MHQIVFEHALLDGDLRAHVEMLHRTTAARAKKLALRAGTDHALSKNIDDLRLFETRFLPVARIGDTFAGQRALDENDLAGRAVFRDGAADAARFHVERVDIEFGHLERAGGSVFARLLALPG